MWLPSLTAVIQTGKLETRPSNGGWPMRKSGPRWRSVIVLIGLPLRIVLSAANGGETRGRQCGPAQAWRWSVLSDHRFSGCSSRRRLRRGAAVADGFSNQDDSRRRGPSRPQPHRRQVRRGQGIAVAGRFCGPVAPMAESSVRVGFGDNEDLPGQGHCAVVPATVITSTASRMNPSGTGSACAGCPRTATPRCRVGSLPRKAATGLHRPVGYPRFRRRW